MLVLEKIACLCPSFLISLDLMKPSELKVLPSFPMQGVPILITQKHVSGMKLIRVSISGRVMLSRSRKDAKIESLKILRRSTFLSCSVKIKRIVLNYSYITEFRPSFCLESSS